MFICKSLQVFICKSLQIFLCKSLQISAGLIASAEGGACTAFPLGFYLLLEEAETGRMGDRETDVWHVLLRGTLQIMKALHTNLKKSSLLGVLV